MALGVTLIFRVLSLPFPGPFQYCSALCLHIAVCSTRSRSRPRKLLGEPCQHGSDSPSPQLLNSIVREANKTDCQLTFGNGNGDGNGTFGNGARNRIGTDTARADDLRFPIVWASWGAMERPGLHRVWVSVYFECCNAYVRVYFPKGRTETSGRCPRCLRPVRFVLSEDGDPGRFFRAETTG